ncbi:3902_t:CDS:2, partial [Gigaspora margarita]
MSLSSKAKKHLHESLQQQCLNQKLAEYNEAKRLFIDLTDLDYKSGHKEHIFYKYCLTFNGHISSSDRNDNFVLVNHLSKVYRIPDTHEYIDEDLLSQILVPCADALSLIPGCMPFLNSFALASSSNAKKCKLAKEGQIKRPAISSVKNKFKNLDNYLVQPKENYSEILPQTFSFEEPVKEESQPIDNKNALVKRANIVIEKYSFNKVSDKVESKMKSKWRLIKRLLKALSTLHQFLELSGESINIKEIEDALDTFLDFLNEEPSSTLICSTIGTGKTKTLRKILAYLAQSCANLPCTIWVSYRKTLSNKSEAKLKELKKFDFKVKQYQNIVANLKICEWNLIIVQVEGIFCLDFQESHSCIAILDKVNATMHQLASGVHAQKFFNTMRNLLNIATYIVAMDAFANNSTL